MSGELLQSLRPLKPETLGTRVLSVPGEIGLFYGAYPVVYNPWSGAREVDAERLGSVKPETLNDFAEAWAVVEAPFGTESSRLVAEERHQALHKAHVDRTGPFW